MPTEKSGIDLTPHQITCLQTLLTALINQEAAQVIVTPYEAKPGFWFGGGNLAQDKTGAIWLSGRYRNFGDSRIGLKAGQRGLEIALFRSADGGQTFNKIQTWSKADLSYPNHEVLSIEGAALHKKSDGTWELFISSEKALPYPEELAGYQKPGAGVWTIDRLTGPSPAELEAATIEPVLENKTRPEYLHIKDPVVFDGPTGETVMIFCSHPFSWTSTNTGLALRPKTNETKAEFQIKTWEMVSRGAGWDVAATRITNKLPLPRLGVFADMPPCAVYFYDGAECLRQLDENPMAHKRPRGYSCEEIGGAFFSWDPDEGSDLPCLQRLDPLSPWFISPYGTGCSRYVDTLVTGTGILAVWQQSQPDQSQPLVRHFLPMTEVEAILTKAD